MIAGIDEAGRGSVLGPLVIGVVAGGEDLFLNRGFKDSKLLVKSKRLNLLSVIKSLGVHYEVLKIPADEINHLMEKRVSLNEIEAMKVAVLIDGLPEEVNTVYVDSPDPLPERFESRIRKYTSRNLRIVSEHKADMNYPVVSAASILAKVTRDEEIKRIGELIGLNVSSGYPSDEYTINALEYMLKNKMGLEYIRFKWKTVENLLSQQKSLSDFF